MHERFLRFVRFAGIDLRSSQEIVAASDKAEQELEKIVAQFGKREITHEEFRRRVTEHRMNPDAKLDLRRAGENLGTP